MTLEEKLQNLPDAPGVYIMKDAKGHVVYIGKAVSLKSRVRSYFQKGAKDEKTEALVRTITDLETIVTHTELEALILEATLIKKHRPRFHIILRAQARRALCAAPDRPVHGAVLGGKRSVRLPRHGRSGAVVHRGQEPGSARYAEEANGGSVGADGVRARGRAAC